MPTSEREHWLSIRQHLPSRRVEIPYHRKFTAAEAERLRAGVWPQGTDDRWVIELGTEALQMWRSWTGYCVYRLPVRATNETVVAGPLFVNNEPGQHRRTSDAYDIQTVEVLIGICFGKDV